MPTPARAETHRPAVHAARALGRLRRRHGLPGPRRRRRRDRRLDLRPARVLRRPRPPGAARPLRPAAAAAASTPARRLSTRVALAAGEAAERVFLLGYADSAGAARQLATLAAATPRDAAHGSRCAAAGIELLGATTVQTPDPLFDAMVNRWLLYQTVSCRLWAKAGFYQAGGATGFRDQLQDAMALAWAAPADAARADRVCARRASSPRATCSTGGTRPLGAGVRTHFSDDLLWLAHACVHYLRATGDAALLDQRVPFIEGAADSRGRRGRLLHAHRQPAARHRSTSMPHAPSIAACASARTACR